MQRAELHRQGRGQEEEDRHGDGDRTHPRCKVLASEIPLPCLATTFLPRRPEPRRQTPAATHRQKAKQLTFKSALFESQNSTPQFVDLKLLEITKTNKKTYWSFS